MEGKGGKNKIAMGKDPVVQTDKSQLARQELKEALKRSGMEAKRPKTSRHHQAAVEVCKEEEEFYLDMIVDNLLPDKEAEHVVAECRLGVQCKEEDSGGMEREDRLEEDGGMGGSTQEGRTMREERIEEDGVKEEHVEMEESGEMVEDQRMEDEDEGIEGNHSDREQMRKGNGKQPSLRPDLDHDPNPPQEDGEVFVPDYLGWTQSLKKVKVQKFKGAKPKGPTFQKHQSPVKYFLQFFSPDMFTKLTEWTNFNLLTAGERTPTTAQEIRAWFGTRIVMGLVRTSNYQDYWSTDPGYYNRLIATTMTRNRFDMLSKHLACADPKTNPENYLLYDPSQFLDKKHQYASMKNTPLYPIQPLWDDVVSRCNANFNLGQHLAIDEAMVQYSGLRNSEKVLSMPLKQVRACFKIHAMADAATGYISNFTVHPYKEGKPAKMLEITMAVAAPNLGRYHHIFTDKRYTSVALARKLLSNKTYLTGAVKSTSKRLPIEFSSNRYKNPMYYKKVKRLNKMPRGTFYSRQHGQMTCVIWKDSRIIELLSTAHQGFRDRKADILSRKIIDESGRQKVAAIPVPQQVVDYKKHIGGVDRADQLRSFYSCSRKSQLWWRKLLYFLVDVCRVNAWICYCHHHPQDRPDSSESEDTQASGKSNQKTHAGFTMDVAKGLIAGFSTGNVLPQSDTRPVSCSQPHCREKMPGKYAKRCRWCVRKKLKNSAGHTPMTRHGCIICNVNLCEGRCFLEFHGANQDDGTEHEEGEESSKPDSYNTA